MVECSRLCRKQLSISPKCLVAREKMDLGKSISQEPVAVSHRLSHIGEENAMLKPVLDNPWVRAACAVCAVAVTGVLCYVLSPALVPLFLAFLVAYTLDPVVDFFEARKIPRSCAVGALAILGILLLVGIPLFLVPSLISEADQLISAATSATRAEGQGVIAAWCDRLLEALPLDYLVRAMGWVEPDAELIDARAILGEKIGEYVKTHASQLAQSFAPHFASVGQKAGLGVAQFFAALGRGTVGVIIFLGNLALFAFVAGYLLKDFDGLVAGARELVPPKYREKTFAIVGKIDVQIRSFLRGQMLVCLCLGIMYAVGLLISGVPFAVVIAAFGAVASFVPYLGLVLTMGPAVILTLLQHGLDWHVIGVLLTFVIAQSVEGTILTPKIVGEQVGLNPVWVILAILVFSSTLGFLGLLLAVPLAASLKVLVVEGVAYYKRSPVFEGGGPDDGAS